jgi:HK97 family phage portal protein
MIPFSKQVELSTRSLENPANSITCEALSSRGTSASGEVITPATGWNYSAVYAAIRLLAETVAQLPLNLYRREGSRVSIASDEPLHNLLHDAPSEIMTSFVWRETQMVHTQLYGNGYSYIARDVSGAPMELQLLQSSQTHPYIHPDGRIEYYSTINNKPYRIKPADILHVPAMGLDGIVGKSPITIHRETLGLSAAATKFGAQLFGSGTNIGGVISTEKSLGHAASANIKAGYNEWKGDGYSGALLLDESMKYSRIGMPPEDAQFLETRRFQLSEVARIYNIPNHMLRDLEKASFNNIAELSLDFLRYSMAPHLIRHEQEYNRKLLTPDQRKTLYFKFQAGGLLRGTQPQRYEAYASSIQNGWMTRNEVRELEELNPIEGLDDVLIPLNMETQSERDSKPEPEEETQPAIEPPAKADDRSRFAPIARNAASSFARFLSDTAKKEDRAARFSEKFAPMLERHIEPVFEAAGNIDLSAWHRWLKTIDIDGEMPGTDEIYTEMAKVIGIST